MLNKEKQKVDWKDVKIIKVQNGLSFTTVYKYFYK